MSEAEGLREGRGRCRKRRQLGRSSRRGSRSNLRRWQLQRPAIPAAANPQRPHLPGVQRRLRQVDQLLGGAVGKALAPLAILLAPSKLCQAAVLGRRRVGRPRVDFGVAARLAKHARRAPLGAGHRGGADGIGGGRRHLQRRGAVCGGGLGSCRGRVDEPAAEAQAGGRAPVRRSGGQGGAQQVGGEEQQSAAGPLGRCVTWGAALLGWAPAAPQPPPPPPAHSKVSQKGAAR